MGIWGLELRYKHQTLQQSRKFNNKRDTISQESVV